jgi:hypothetical protein
MKTSSRGFSLIEVVFALGIVTVAVLGLAGVMAGGMRHLSNSPSHVIAAQEAAQAVEAVFAARDSHKLTWARIRNVNGAGGDGGVFLDGAQALHKGGPDGLVNTGDDLQALETITLPGPDGVLNTPDDRTVNLDGFTRDIHIRDVPNEGGQLRSIVVTIEYPSGTGRQTYTLTTFISPYA